MGNTDKRTISLVNWYEKPEIAINYIKDSSKINIINWFDLPETTQFLLKKIPPEIKKVGRSNFISVFRLKKAYGKDIKLNNNIIGIKKFMAGNTFLRVKFPINLNNKDYVRLYSLMNSEGYHNPEFSIQVPEEHFHAMFSKTIGSLLSIDFAKEIRIRLDRSIKKSLAPAKTRHFIPIPKHLPLLILNNKEFSREYLRVAFDAEGSALVNKKRHKRYIKLSRYVGISNFVTENLPLQKRIYINVIKEKYPFIFNKIRYFPPPTLLGEYLLLKKHFNINSSIKLEAIKRNKTSFRAGGISARWVLYIYADNLDKFIKEINFISRKKRNKCRDMLKFKTNKSQYYALRKMKEISYNNIFRAKDFIENMRKEGYISPYKYIWDYNRKGLMKQMRKGEYKLIL